MARFDDCLKFILKSEGGFVNDPDDNGGMTYKGICRKYYPNLFMWNIIDSVLADGGDRKQINRILEDSFNVQSEIANIYKQEYWNKCNCDSLYDPLDLIVFDTAVNMGVSKAKNLLKQTEEPDTYILLRAEAYREICRKNPKQTKFLQGWLNRLSALCNECGIIFDSELEVFKA